MSTTTSAAIASAGIGHLSAITVPIWFGYSGTTTAGAMAVAAGLLFLLAWLGSPTQGILASIVKKFETRALILRQDILGLLWRFEEREQHPHSLDTVATMLRVNKNTIVQSLKTLARQGEISDNFLMMKLTSKGRESARAIVRSHRLWEVYLDKHYPQDKNQIHHAASRLEHVTTEQMQDDLGGASIDPHGRRVP